MQFRNILVPVDFTENTEVALSKAVELSHCIDEKITIHLLHNQRIVIPGVLPTAYHFFWRYPRNKIKEDVERSKHRLAKIKTFLLEQKDNINVIPWIVSGESVQDSIIRKAKSVSADLIVIGKSSHHSIFPFLNTVGPGVLAATTGIPVLTVKPGALNHEVRTVVIPVSRHFPVNKLRALEAFRFKTRSNIRLVTFSNEETDDSRRCLLQTFRTLKNNLSNPVNYEILDGRNKAKALLRYCIKVSADMLVVYPGSETQMGGWANSHISDCIPARSRTQVLAVAR